MADEVKPGNAKLPNVKALVEFRLKGEVIGVGDILAKSDFSHKQDWLNLLNMPKPRVEETDEKPKRASRSERVAAAAKVKDERAGSAKPAVAKAPGA